MRLQMERKTTESAAFCEVGFEKGLEIWRKRRNSDVLSATQGSDENNNARKHHTGMVPPYHHTALRESICNVEKK